MAQTKAGAEILAARAAGVTLEDFRIRRAAGLKWCYKCREWRSSADDFSKDVSRGDGRTATCRYCRTKMVGRGAHRKPPRVKRPLRGWHHSPESRARQSATMRTKASRGESHHAYKDGKLAERRGERFSQEYKRWRRDVFTRDGFTCQSPWCGDSRGGNLHAHHIKSFADHPEFRFDLDNGVTVCTSCHQEIHQALKG